MEFLPLYKRNANNTINKWVIFVDGNCYWSEFGKVNGRVKKSKKVYCFGKNKGRLNETSNEEQAIHEASSIWRRKIEREGFVKDMAEVLGSSCFNQPMLAKVYDGVYNDRMKYIQPKLDGVRCNISLEDGSVTSVSRHNVRFSSTKHIEKELAAFFNEFSNVHLDGELYNHELHDNFSKIVSLVKKNRVDENENREIEANIKFYVYDLWIDGEENASFFERYELIKCKLNGLENVVIVPTFEIKNSDDIEYYYNQFVGDGYEGAIIRANTPYEHKRSKNLLKYKKFQDDEFLVIDVNVGKNKTIAESCKILLKNGKECNATLAFSDEICKNIIENKERYIGKLATVSYFGKTSDGYLRFPVIKEINRKSYE